jgi:hypothetical protein
MTVRGLLIAAAFIALVGAWCLWADRDARRKFELRIDDGEVYQNLNLTCERRAHTIEGREQRERPPCT